jgi:RIP metalloprotease RseP
LLKGGAFWFSSPPFFLLSIEGEFFYMSLLYAILALGLLIVLHEAGHFFVARWCGMKVYEFAVGFGPLLFQVRHKGVEYSFRAIPLGGYVRIAGMDPEADDAQEPDGFLQSAPWKRFATIFAGPLANYITAFAIFFFVYGYWGIPDRVVKIRNVAAKTSAATLGLKAGDQIIAVDQQMVTGIPARPLGIHLQELIAKEKGKSLALLVQRVEEAPKERKEQAKEALPASLPSSQAAAPASLPSAQAVSVVASEQSKGEVVIRYAVKKEAGEFFQGVVFSQRETLRVEEMRASSAMAAAGLQKGDTIVEIGGKAASDPLLFHRLLQSDAKGAVEAVIHRGGRRLRVFLPRSKAHSAEKSGIHLVVQPELLLNEVKIEAVKQGLRKGDRLLAVGGVKLEDRPALSPTEHLHALLSQKSERERLLQVVRGGKLEKIRWPKGQRVETLGWELRPTQWVLVLNTLANSTAQKMGMKSGDRILSIEGREVHTVAQLLDGLRQRIHRPIRVEIERKGKSMSLIAPKADDPEAWRLGFQPQLDYPLTRSGFGEAASQAISQVWLWNTRIWDGLSKIFRGREKANLTGPVGIVTMANQSVQQGAFFFLIFISVISIHLAFFNLLPIPALDGGRILFLLLQQGFRAAGADERVGLRIETYAHVLGFILVFSLLIFATYKDIARLIFGG